MRSRNIQADILDFISDNKVHTYQAIADAVECSYITVYRHVQALAYRFNIETFKGGIDKGGIRYIGEQKVDVEKLTSDDLQLIISKLSSLQDDNPRIKSFIHKLSTQKDLKESKHEK